ncbi:MAG: hypothetical protein JNM17_00265 [Archangium sp.]|nr:hypothetical protein [Archangium sp.]
MLTVLVALMLSGDGGTRLVSATLGGPITEVTGEVWPSFRGKPSDSHEFKGPVLAVLRMPSGREFRATTTSMMVNTRVVSTGLQVRSVYFDLGDAPTWAEIVERAQQPLKDLGISEEERAEKKKRTLAMKPPAFPSYEVEPCVVVTTTLRPNRLGFYLSLEFTHSEPPCRK